MKLYTVEHERVFENSHFHYFSDKNYLIILVKSPANYNYNGENFSKASNQVLCIRPGRHLELTGTEPFLTLDYVEFSPAADVCMEELPLPSEEPICPAHFFELSGWIKQIYTLYYSGCRYRAQKINGFLRILVHHIASGDETPNQQDRMGYHRFRLRLLQRFLSDSAHHGFSISIRSIFISALQRTESICGCTRPVRSCKTRTGPFPALPKSLAMNRSITFTGNSRSILASLHRITERITDSDANLLQFRILLSLKDKSASSFWALADSRLSKKSFYVILKEQSDRRISRKHRSFPEIPNILDSSLRSE